LRIEIPGRAALELEHLVLDVNGTLAGRGTLLEGVAERVSWIAPQLEVHLLSADTFGTLDVIERELGVSARRISTGNEKRAFVAGLGAERCAAIGNGANDAGMLEAAALGIAVLGPEGAAVAAIAAADVVCRSLGDALDVLLDPRALAATFRP
jgi:P-type E1-E2 ATPase